MSLDHILDDGQIILLDLLIGYHDHLPAQQLDILQIEADVEQRQKVVDELEEQQFGDAVALKLRLGAVIFCANQTLSQLDNYDCY